LSLRILVSLGYGETPKESSSRSFATPIQRHMRFPYLEGEDKSDHHRFIRQFVRTAADLGKMFR
jgi:hypothetical protein